MKRGPKPRRNPYDRSINPRGTKFVADIIRRVDEGKVDHDIAEANERRIKRERREGRERRRAVERDKKERAKAAEKVRRAMERKTAAEKRAAATAARAAARAAAKAAKKADEEAARKTAERAKAAAPPPLRVEPAPEGAPGRCARPGCHHYAMHHGALPEDVVADRCSVMGCDCPGYVACAKAAS